MKIIPINNQNDYNKQTSFKNLIKIKPNHAIQYEDIKLVGVNESFGFIRFLTFTINKGRKFVSPALETLRYKIKPGEDFFAIVKKAHETGDDSLLKIYNDSEVQPIRSNPVINMNSTSEDLILTPQP